ncbi:fibropellin-1-like [Mercenaria mercenaria]|uniref:fibropellin-1-like n=1 Tax=Mercenaria mercenaria TaxID=6596 RepID=UPI00234E71AA|nr:fibropellin-1-like [Mercenaria mercenaria]
MGPGISQKRIRRFLNFVTDFILLLTLSYYVSATDINECKSTTCLNGASCIDGTNGYTCSCKAGFSGDLCQTDIDECKSSPCQNEAICTDIINGYVCTCVAGYSGVRCESDVDECRSIPCKHGAVCTDNINSYFCTCMSGYTGINCEIGRSMQIIDIG